MISDSHPYISVVIPLYRESANVEQTVAEVERSLDAVTGPKEIILVDDGSPDQTWEVIENLSRSRPHLRGVRLSRNFGKEQALCVGLELAQGEAVIVMDGDLQHPPHLMAQMIRYWSEGRADVVEAVKISRGNDSWLSRINARLFYFLLNRLSGYDLSGLSDYKLLDRKVIDAWLRMRERNVFFRGMVAWLGFKHVRIPFSVPERVRGESGWSTFRLIRLALTAVTAFSTVPLHFTTGAGILFLLFALIVGTHTLYLKFIGQAVSGFTTVIILLLLIGSALLIAMGILGEYIARIYRETKDRPRYVVTETIPQGLFSRRLAGTDRRRRKVTV